jgi:hypothetical protein
MTALKGCGAIFALAWAAYMTWEVHRTHVLAGEACQYAADAQNSTPGPGLDDRHRDMRMVCE